MEFRDKPKHWDLFRSFSAVMTIIMELDDLVNKMTMLGDDIYGGDYDILKIINYNKTD